LEHNQPRRTGLEPGDQIGQARGRLNKSDPADAEGLAQLACTGWFRGIHVKSLTSDRRRATIAARDRLIRIGKDLEGSGLRDAGQAAPPWPQ
jgi:transposase